MPRTILLYNAKEFTSQQFRTLCEKSEIQLGYVTPYHPQGNSISERMHGTMKAVLASLCKGQPTRWT